MKIYLCKNLIVGGYMFPIRGLVLKQDHRSPWVIYNKIMNSQGKEKYEILAALPPYPTPERSEISRFFTG